MEPGKKVLNVNDMKTLFSKPLPQAFTSTTPSAAVKRPFSKSPSPYSSQKNEKNENEAKRAKGYYSGGASFGKPNQNNNNNNNNEPFQKPNEAIANWNLDYLSKKLNLASSKKEDAYQPVKKVGLSDLPQQQHLELPSNNKINNDENSETAATTTKKTVVGPISTMINDITTAKKMEKFKLYDEKDSRFEQDLKDSLKHVEQVSKMFTDYVFVVDHDDKITTNSDKDAKKKKTTFSFTVKIPEMVIRPDVTQMCKFSDDGDLFCTLSQRDSEGNLLKKKEYRMEVKQRMLHFPRGLIDFPYPDVIVDVAHAFEKAEVANKKPFAYVMTDKNVRGTICILGSTSPLWTKKQTRDTVKSRDRVFYYASKSQFCDFSAMCEAMKNDLLS